MPLKRCLHRHAQVDPPNAFRQMRAWQGSEPIVPATQVLMAVHAGHFAEGWQKGHHSPANLSVRWPVGTSGRVGGSPIDRRPLSSSLGASGNSHHLHRSPLVLAAPPARPSGLALPFHIDIVQVHISLGGFVRLRGQHSPAVAGPFFVGDYMPCRHTP